MELRKDPERKASRRSSAAKAGPARSQHITDPAGWEALRAKRKELADEQGVPPFVIFHDTTLQELLERRPATLDEMSQVSGVGAAKLERYGEIFLEVLNSLPGDS